MKALLVFLALQLMDIATTIFALGIGGVEQNPIIRHFMAIGPIPGLILSKLVVIALAGVFVFIGKTKPVRLANVAFAMVVIWNVTIIARLGSLS